MRPEPPRARVEPASVQRALEAIVQDPQRPLASVSALVMRGGEIVFEAQAGRAFISADGTSDRPADARSLYRVASISKLVVTIGVLRLVEDGRLSLDADLGAALGWALRNPHFPDAPITARMVLTHTSSLRDDAGYFWDEGPHLRDVLGGDGAMWAREAPPGAQFRYANLPWGVLATAMEQATGERFDRLMRRLVLEPLRMHGGFNPADLPVDEIATLYRKRETIDGKEVWKPAGPWIAQVDDYGRSPPVCRAGPRYVPGTNGTLFAPQGGLRASARDLAQAARLLIGGGVLDGSRVLSRASVEQMFSLQWKDPTGRGEREAGVHPNRMLAWGLGVQHFTDTPGADRLVEGGGFRASGHHGDAWGLTGVLAIDRAAGDALIFLCGGPGFDPDTDRGRYSAFRGYEERILTTLHRGVLAA